MYIPLVVDASFAPNAGSEAAVYGDVQQPWLAPTTTNWDGTFVPPVVKLDGSVDRYGLPVLLTATGAEVHSLKEAVYEITVKDLSTKDNFHLSGGLGVNRKTGVAGKGTVTWKLALKPGTYRYRSDAHPSLGSTFTINPHIAAPQPPPERTVSTPLDGTFVATISGSAGATLNLIDPTTGQSLASPTLGSLSYTICGKRSMLLRVTGGQSGSFHVSVQMP